MKFESLKSSKFASFGTNEIQDIRNPYSGGGCYLIKSSGSSDWNDAYDNSTSDLQTTRISSGGASSADTTDTSCPGLVGNGSSSRSVSFGRLF